jgi:hypothetical protein
MHGAEEVSAMHGTINPPKPTVRPSPIITLMTDDFAGTCDVITIHPEAFALSRKEIARELRKLISGWIEKNANA